jgi:hypothetical protein
MKRDTKKLQEISASITHYYDSITDEEVAVNLAWGEFAETQFVDGDSGDHYSIPEK